MFKHDSVLVGLQVRCEAPPFECATRLLRRSAVTLQHKEATVFLQRFSNLRNVFQLSFVRGERDNGEKKGEKGGKGGERGEKGAATLSKAITAGPRGM